MTHPRRTPPAGWIAILLLLASLLSTVATAQDDPATGPGLRQAEAEIRTVVRQAEQQGEQIDATEGAILRARVAAARQSADAAAEQLTVDLAALDARIAGLGPGSAAEAPEVRRQRASLAAERQAIDAALKRARLLDVEAQQIDAEMQQQDERRFGQRMSRREPSPLLPAFWGNVVASFDDDMARIGRFLEDGRRQATLQGRQAGVLFALAGLAVAVLLLSPGRRAALRLGQRYLVNEAAGRPLRRSAYALWSIFVGTLMATVAAVALVQGTALSNLLPPNWTPLLFAFTFSAAVAGFTAALFGAVLMHGQPAWRLAPMHDALANRLRPLAWILVTISFAGSLIDAFNGIVGAGRAALSASMVLQTAASLLLIGGALLAIGRGHAAERQQADAGGTPIAAANAGVSVLALGLWITVLVASLALALGFVEFSSFVVTMIVVATIVGAFTYLLMRLVDDGAAGLFNRSSRLGRTLVGGLGLRGGAVDQFGVVLSGILRVIIGFLAFLVLLAPFGGGSGVGSILAQIASVADGVDFGGVSVSPGAIVRGIVVLLIGLALVRGFMAWLEKRYLPTTDLDSSARNSVSLIARYLGIGLAAIWGLASLGIGVERVALLLSALSVGIGFGLQAITQNFISGLILLAERPIKIGDLIKVGNDEGDVRRISVRSTELVLGDHSTLIIPNSELITKSVLNKTLARPLGRVQIQFSVPIDVDAAVVEQILLDAFRAEPAILQDPAPSVFIDSIVDGRMVFNSFAHVDSPRASYGARSNVFKALIGALRDRKVDIGTAPLVLANMPPDVLP